MKKTLLIIAVCLIATSAAFSQEFKFGVGGVVGTKSGIKETGEFKMNFGANARVLYDFSEKFAITGGFTYFLPSKVTHAGEEMKLNIMALNADAVYYLMDDNNVKVYGLGGVNWASAKVSFMGADVTTSEFSWEAGAGVMFSNFFIEAKYDGNMEQILGVVGIYF